MYSGNSLAVFLSHVVSNFANLGDKYCKLCIAYVEKRCISGIEYREYDGLESYWISKEKFIFSLIAKNKTLSDSEFGRLIREEANRKPLEYNNECDLFLTSDEKNKCKAILDKFIETNQIPKSL